MRKGYNKVIFAGRIHRSPELRRTPHGVAVGTFSLLVPKSTEKEDDLFVDVVAFRTLAEEYCPLLTHGKAVLVEGMLAPGRWNKAEGAVRNTYEVRASLIRIIE